MTFSINTHMFIWYILVHHLVMLSHLFIHVFCKLDVRTYDFPPGVGWAWASPNKTISRMTVLLECNYYVSSKQLVHENATGKRVYEHQMGEYR